MLVDKPISVLWHRGMRRYQVFAIANGNVYLAWRRTKFAANRIARAIERDIENGERRG